MWPERCWSASGVLTSREGGAEATGAVRWEVFREEEEESGGGNENNTAHLQAHPEINLY